jgi:hypoxanthine phosphoribosyltransferase
MKSYDYGHRFGVRQLSWEDFASLARHLAELLEPHQPQIILGVARAGLFPATAVACNLRCEFYPVRLTRRVNDEILYDRPMWKTPPPAEVQGMSVAVVDEIADTGQTLAMVAESASALGALNVVTSSLVTHTWADPFPQISAMVSDEFIIFPWDREVLVGGKWMTHPEITTGLNAQT